MQWFSVSLLVSIAGYLLPQTVGHGYMKLPPARTYAWQYYGNLAKGYFPVNYNFNQNFCGGFGAQYNSVNNGRCGICGDEYRLAKPRPNERGGKFSTGNLVAQYASGDIINVDIVLTANHRGRFFFDICPSKSPKTLETEDCFEALYVYDPITGQLKSSYELTNFKRATFTVQVNLPKGLTCTYCVLRWRYVTANNWGCSDNQPTKCCTGCGSKNENFYSCADVRISWSGKEYLPSWLNMDKSETMRPITNTPQYPQRTTPRRPATTTTRKTTTTPTTTTRVHSYTEPIICSQLCERVCKKNYFQFMCSYRICGKCRVYQQYLYLYKVSG